ncbi:MAG: GxxExxY protein [Bacteroidales bacterium]|nr:GxxExxY protein [Bacteroidales bacterium]
MPLARQKSINLINYLASRIMKDIEDLIYEVRGAAMEVYNSVEEFNPVYYKQLRTYLKLLHKDVGLLINFGEYDFKKGMRRIVL